MFTLKTFSSDPRLFARDMAIDCPRLLFLLVEDRLLPSPRLIDLRSVAVSSTKLCVYAPSNYYLFTTCNNIHVCSHPLDFCLLPTRKAW